MCGDALPSIHEMVKLIVWRVKSRTPLMATLPLHISASSSQYQQMYSLIGMPPPMPPVKVTHAP
jgi:hypothetical protein